ncbi:MAG: hypothetical protein ACRELF_14405, partial [Gemmataceae bacterium]
MRGNYLALAVVLTLAGVADKAEADVTISTAATQDMSCSGGVCAPTAKDAVLNVGDLESLLASGNVEVTTTGSGVQAKNIDIDAALSWSATSTLSLDAHDSIAVDKPVTVAGLSGLSIATNDGGTGGTFSFGKKGHVTFQNLSSLLAINGTVYTLVGTIAALASAIQQNPAGAYALAADYNASKDGTYKNSPVQTTLTGAVEGLGNTISKLKIKYHSKAYANVGLFSTIGTGGIVENLRLAKLRFKLDYEATGGGFVGLNDGTMFGDQVSGYAEVVYGGLVGVNNGTIASSWADVDIPEGSGGFVGENYGTISLSHANGAVPDGAGFVEDNEGSISQSYATGAAGAGFVDYNEGDQTWGEIDNSYATGALSGGSGFAGVDGGDGRNNATIFSSYSTGAVGKDGAGFDCEAADYDSFSYDYWDTTTSGTEYGFCDDENGPGVTGISSKKLRSGLPDGFDRK